MNEKVEAVLNKELATAERKVSVAKAKLFLADKFGFDKVCESSDSHAPMIACWCAECHESLAEYVTFMANAISGTEKESYFISPEWQGIKSTHLYDYAKHLNPNESE